MQIKITISVGLLEWCKRHLHKNHLHCFVLCQNARQLDTCRFLLFYVKKMCKITKK